MNGTETKVENEPSLLASLWRYRYMLAISVVISAVLGYFLSSLQPAQYQAESLISLRDPSEARLISDTGFFADSAQFVGQQADLASSRRVLERAAEVLGGQDVKSLEDSVVVEPQPEVGRISLIATAPTAQASADRVNAVGQAFEEVARNERLNDTEAGNAVLNERVTTLRTSVEELNTVLGRNPADAVARDQLRAVETELLALEGRMSELLADAAVFGAGVRFREVAEIPEEPASPRPMRGAILAAALTAVVGSMGAYWRAGRHPAIVRGRRDPGAVLQVPLLGEIPKYRDFSDGLSALIPGGEASEAFQFVLASMDFALAEVGGSSVLITSAAPGDGKTSTALQLAISMVREGREVVLVDADTRAHGLTSLLKATHHPGLLQLAEDDAPLQSATRRFLVSDDKQLAVIPAGRASTHSHLNFAALVRAPQFKNALHRIKENGKFVIIDSPPLLAVADATVIAAHVDAVVLVIDRAIDMEQLRKLKERLTFVSAPLIGYISNRAHLDRTARYGYSYGSNGSAASTGGLKRFRLPQFLRITSAPVHPTKEVSSRPAGNGR